jgi:hypothetical protein
VNENNEALLYASVMFAIVIFLTVVLSDKVIKWLGRRRANRILRTIAWPK